jgi:hypothetical protein
MVIQSIEPSELYDSGRRTCRLPPGDAKAVFPVLYGDDFEAQATNLAAFQQTI